MLKNKKIPYKTIIFTLVGALAGFLYAFFVGCKTGTCPITSNKFIATIFMGFFGFVLSIDSKNKQKGEKQDDSNQQ